MHYVLAVVTWHHDVMMPKTVVIHPAGIKYL